MGVVATLFTNFKCSQAILLASTPIEVYIAKLTLDLSVSLLVIH